MINDTIDYAGRRKAFGRSILDNQVVHFRLAELKTEVEMLRALTWRIGLSAGLFVLLLVALWQGWITPHGVGR